MPKGTSNPGSTPAANRINPKDPLLNWLAAGGYIISQTPEAQNQKFDFNRDVLGVGGVAALIGVVLFAPEFIPELVASEEKINEAWGG